MGVQGDLLLGGHRPPEAVPVELLLVEPDTVLGELDGLHLLPVLAAEKEQGVHPPVSSELRADQHAQAAEPLSHVSQSAVDVDPFELGKVDHSPSLRIRTRSSFLTETSVLPFPTRRTILSPASSFVSTRAKDGFFPSAGVSFFSFFSTFWMAYSRRPTVMPLAWQNLLLLSVPSLYSFTSPSWKVSGLLSISSPPFTDDTILGHGRPPKPAPEITLSITAYNSRYSSRS